MKRAQAQYRMSCWTRKWKQQAIFYATTLLLGPAFIVLAETLKRIFG